MPEQKKIQAPKEQEDQGRDQPPVNETKTGKDNKEIDDLIDKVDDLLEENAEEFVKNYVQKGGE